MDELLFGPTLAYNLPTISQEKKKARRQQRERAKSTGGKDKAGQKKAQEPVAPVWPPQRRHHKKPLSPEAKSVHSRVVSSLVACPNILPVVQAGGEKRSYD